VNRTLVEPTIAFLVQAGPVWLSADTVGGGACISCGTQATGFLFERTTNLAMAVCWDCLNEEGDVIGRDR
jgi:hypothetical protein